MNPVLVLTDERVQVEPGGEARTTVRIRNAGARVEEYSLQVLGPPAEWAEVVPPAVSVYPGTDTEVSIVFRPVRSPSTPSGMVPYGVLCQSREDPDASAVAEGTLDVGAILEVDAALNPQESKGRWRGKHRVDVENNGSGPIRVKLVASDPANALSFALAPDVVEVPAGGRASSSLKVRTRDPILRGQPTQRRFQVSYSRLLSAPGEPPAATKLDGAFTQKPVLSKLVVGAATLALVAAIAGIALLFLGGDDEDKKERALPLDAPEIREVVPSADRVQVVWDPDPNATGYTVQQVQGAEANADVLDEKEPKPGQNAFSWQDLAADTDYCFRLIAVNGDLRSSPSKPVCTHTPALAPIAPPTALRAMPRGEELRVDLTWEDADATAEHFILLDGVKQAEPIGAGIAKAASSVPSPGTYCFSLVGKVGEAETAPASEVCVPVGPPAAAAGADAGGGAAGGGGGGGGGQGGGSTPTTAPGGGGVPVQVDGWVLPVHTVLASDVLVDQQLLQAQDLRAMLEETITPGPRIALNTAIGLAPPGETAWLVFFDGFADEQAAIDFCQAKGIEECTPQLPKTP